MNNRGNIIYVVDDDVSVCRALELLLKPHDYRVKTFIRAAEFLAIKHPRQPSCLVLDVALPDISGPALQKIMAERRIGIPIVFITGHGDIPMSVKTMKSGAVDFLTKPFTKMTLLNAIKNAILKSKYQNKEHDKISKIMRRVDTLTPRELKVFCMVAKGMLNKQIAYKQGTVLQTIKVQRGRVMQKMRAKSVSDLVQFALKAGIITSHH